VVVDLKAVKPLPRPLSLAEIKATPALSKMSLVTSMRLSVQPVTDDEWALLCNMGGL
jgi:predicted RNA-binding protein with PUA-like domain